MNLEALLNEVTLNFEPLSSGLSTVLNNLPKAILVGMVGILIVKVLSRLSFWALHSTRKFSKAMVDVLSSIIDAILWIFLVVTIFQYLGLTNVALALSGSLAVIALAIGTGLSSFAQDIIASIMLARDKDFNIGYAVKIGSTEGVIESMDIRKSRIRTKDKSLHVIPNSVIEKAEWVLVDRETETKKDKK